MSNYTKAVEKNIAGLKAVSTGICPECQTCADTHTDGDLVELQRQWESGEICDEGSSSWKGCEICGCKLGTTVYCWHWIADGEIQHSDNVCQDCVLYLANGDEPEHNETSVEA